MPDNLERAIRSRERGELEEARAILLDLLADRPLDPTVNYQCAWVHDRMGREREAIPPLRTCHLPWPVRRGSRRGDLEPG